LVFVFWTLTHAGSASGSTCAPPKEAARASLELRLGELHHLHDRDTAGIREIVNGIRGYVAGSWHLPIGLTVAELSTHYDTKFYYREAEPFGHCVALAEAKVSVGYDDITVYISSEYPEGSCEYDTILAHEQDHVRINRELLKTYKRKFQEAIARVLRSRKVIFAHRKDEARSAYVLELQRQLKSVVAEMADTRNLKNGAIDTQDNYRRLLAQCENWRGSALQASGSGRPSEQAGPDDSVETAAAASSAQGEPSGQLAPDTQPASNKEPEGPATEEVASAQGEPANQAPKSEPDGVEFVQQGRELSKANARQLEAALKSLPYDFPTRVRLLGFYLHSGLQSFGPTATIEARRRHVLWLIETHPESPVAALPEAMIDRDGHELADEEGYRQGKALWLEQVEKKQGDTAVRQNAAKFLEIHDKAIAETLL